MWRCWRGTRRCAHRDGPPLARVRADEAGGDRGEDQHGLQSLAEHDQRGVGDDRCAAGRARHLGRVGRPGAGRRHEVDGASDECQKRRPEQAAGEAWSGAAGGRGCRRHGALTVWNTNLRHRISPAWSHGVLIGAAHLGRGRWRWSPPQEAISVAIATGLFVAGSHWVGPAANAPAAAWATRRCAAGLSTPPVQRRGVDGPGSSVRSAGARRHLCRCVSGLSRGSNRRC